MTETGQLDGRSAEINADHLPVIHGFEAEEQLQLARQMPLESTDPDKAVLGVTW